MYLKKSMTDFRNFSLCKKSQRDTLCASVALRLAIHATVSLYAQVCQVCWYASISMPGILR